MFKKILLGLIFTLPVIANAKTLIIGDSLAYSLAESFKKTMPVDAFYLENSGLGKNSPLDWPEYIKTIPEKNYNAVLISLGANDPISDSQIDDYQQKSLSFIKELEKLNQSALITWVMPPVMKNQDAESKMVNVRMAIDNACNASGITCFNVSNAIGGTYSEIQNGIKIRASDGIHYTSKGADLIVNSILGIKEN